jgi:hypothetical protein
MIEKKQRTLNKRKIQRKEEKINHDRNKEQSETNKD